MPRLRILIAATVMLLIAAGRATALGRDELALEVTLGADDPPPGAGYNQGSDAASHYFRKEGFVSGDNGSYRVPRTAATVSGEFPRTHSRGNWRRAEAELDPLKELLKPAGK